MYLKDWAISFFIAPSGFTHQQKHVQVKWKVKVKHLFLKQSKEKHVNNSLEMKRVPQAHVEKKL